MIEGTVDGVLESGIRGSPWYRVVGALVAAALLAGCGAGAHGDGMAAPGGGPVAERELLVILDAVGAGRAARELEGRLRVVQAVPPRILVVRGGEDALASLAAAPGVARTLERGADAPTLPGLSEGERLFVHGWLARVAPKQQPGDGLDWDAPGYTPP